MPIYEYTNRRTGETVMLRIPVEKRNDLVKVKGQIFDRQEIPSRITVLGGHLPPGGANDVMKGYYSEEQKQGSNFKSEFTKNEIKKAWSNNDMSEL